MKAPQFIADMARDATPMPEPFRQLCVLEPGLAELWGDARYYSRYWGLRPAESARGRQASWVAIRGELVRLAGWRRVGKFDDILSSASAYDCAERALMGALGA